MKKGKLVCTKSLLVSGLWRFDKYYTDTIYLFIRRYPIMHWVWRGLLPKKEPSRDYEYKYSLSVPYIVDKYYDGEYSTNRYIKTLETSIKQKLNGIDLDCFKDPEFAASYKLTGLTDERIYDREKNINII